MGTCCGIAVGITRYIFFIANVLVMIAAAVIIVVGVQMLQDLNIYDMVLANEFTVTPIVVMSIGGTICLFAFFGSCGALIESRWVLIMYCFFLMLALLAEFAVGAYALLQYNHVDDFMKTRVQEYFDKEYYNTTSSANFDKIQERLHCCGARGSEDYLPIFGNDSVPDSCCVFTAPCTQQTASPDGCTIFMTQFVVTLFGFLGVITLSLAGVKIIGLVVGMCLASYYKSKPQPLQQPQPAPAVIDEVTTTHSPPPYVDLSTYQYHLPSTVLEVPVKEDITYEVEIHRKLSNVDVSP